MRHFAWLLLLIATTALCDEPRYYFEQVASATSPSQHTVRTWLQDRTGYVWLGTDSGLFRYDSYAFRRPQVANSEQAEPLGGVVNALAEDANGRLWVGLLADGLWRLDPATGTVIRAEAVQLRDRSINLLRVTDDGIWVGSGASVFLLESDSGRLLQQVNIDPEPTGMGALRDSAIAGDGALWIAASNGLFRIARGAKKAVAVDPTRTGPAMTLLRASNGRLFAGCVRGLFEIDGAMALKSIWSADETPVTALVESRPGRLWFALAKGGLVRMDLDSDTTLRIGAEGSKRGALPTAPIHGLWVDRSGLLWIGTTSQGLYKLDPRGTRFIWLTDRPGNDNAASLFQSTDGTLWIGTLGDGLKRYVEASGDMVRYKTEIQRAFGIADESKPLLIRSIADGANGTLLLSTQYGIARFDPQTLKAAALRMPDPSTTSPSGVGPLLKSVSGSLWIGTRGNHVARFDENTQRWQSLELFANAAKANLVLALFEAKDGSIWAGSLKGLHQIDPVSGKVRTFRHIAGDPRSLSSNIVRSIHQAADGTIWVGTQAGLNRLDAIDSDTATFSNWPASGALRDDTIYAVLEDARKRLWVSTNRGLIAIDRDSGLTLLSSLRDGLQSMEFNGGAGLRLRNGEMAFGGPNGVNRFDPSLIRRSDFVSPVEITRVQIGKQTLQPVRQEKIEMGAEERLVSIEFAALDYAASSQNRFRYRLVGYDNDWIDAGANHVATYNHLDPGEYTFEVLGSNHDGAISSDTGRVIISVPVPWWMSTWARALYIGFVVAALLLALLLLQRRRAALLRQHTEVLERENRLNMAVWGSGDQFWDWDIKRGLLIRTIWEGHSSSNRVVEIPVDVWQAQVHPEDIDQLRQRMIEHVEDRSDIYESEHRLREGECWRWVLARGRVVERDRSGAAVRISGTSRDITQSRIAEQDRRIATQVLQDMDEAVSVFDLDFNFVSVNPAFTRMTGWHDEDVIGQSTRILDCDQHLAGDYERLRDALVVSGCWSGELWQRRSDGSEFSSWTQLNEVRDAEGIRTHYVGVLTDITERKRSEQELRYLANYDTLTGLPNRTLMVERLSSVVRNESMQPGGVMYLDLDHFKHVNDSYGHAAGDRLLKAAGDRLRQIIDRNDTVSRLGGDEFAIILDRLDHEEHAAAIARRVLRAFAMPIDLGDSGSVTITPSIGVSLFPAHSSNVEELLKFADTAMYQAKGGGRNTFMIYTEAMDAQARERASIIAALRKAIDQDEFRLVFQPRMSLTSGRMCGVEALLRWNSADLGEVGPAQFIPYAEETGLIINIGDWVFRETCAQVARWRREGVRGLTASINVSMMQLQRGNVASRLSALLEEFAIPADQIELELTESVVMANAEQSIGILQKLREVGVTISIDDFGTGYSSLSYLKRLPIDTLKIDKAFVGDITTDIDDRAITATIIAMGRSMGLTVVAEGVETAAQVEFLREHGCDEIQGYWLSKPMPPDECFAFLQERMQRRSPMLGVHQ